MLNSFGAKANTVSIASVMIVLLSAARCRMVSVSLGWLSKPPPPLSIRYYFRQSLFKNQQAKPRPGYLANRENHCNEGMVPNLHQNPKWPHATKT